jgi:F0F1-type ATP synthase assembly protein I
VNINELIPVAVIGLILWALARFQGARPWHLLVAVLAGVVLAGTVIGADISTVLSQLTGGRIH